MASNDLYTDEGIESGRDERKGVRMDGDDACRELQGISDNRK